MVEARLSGVGGGGNDVRTATDIAILGKLMWNTRRLALGIGVGKGVANEIRNEQVKLRASLCNGIAISVVTVGVLIPTIGKIFNWFQSTDPLRETFTNAQIIFVWFVVAMILHIVANACLEGIIENDG